LSDVTLEWDHDGNIGRNGKSVDITQELNDSKKIYRKVMRQNLLEAEKANRSSVELKLTMH